LIFKSVFVLTSRIATSRALCWKFAQTGKGASLMMFPSASANKPKSEAEKPSEYQPIQGKLFFPGSCPQG
jgi:hypothetical protein